MKPSHFLTLLGLCAAGTIGGYGSRRVTAGGTPSAMAADSSARSKASNVGGDAKISTPSEITRRKSEDTVETLLAANPESLYARLAAWMIDATEEDIAAYWSRCKNGQRSSDITELVFIFWTRLNPRGAIAAVTGTEDEKLAWWAWAAHDPVAALAAATAEDGPVSSVVMGISEFAPGWLRENFEKIPGDAREEALSGMAKWTNSEDPEGNLNFLYEHDKDFHIETFLSLVQKDSWAAQDWLRRHPEVLNNSEISYSRESIQTIQVPTENPQDQLFATMARNQPDELERMAAMTPSGQEKTRMEQALFDRLAASDPAAALRQARAAYPPILAAQHLGQLGTKLLRSDPDQAFAIAAEMLEKSGGNFSFAKKFNFGEGKGSFSGGSGRSEAQRFLDSLNTKDRARTVELVATSAKNDAALRQVFEDMTRQWADSDLAGLTNWTNRQTDPDARATSANQISNKLLKQERFEEAMGWASVAPNSEKSLMDIFSPWVQQDRGAAAAWLGAANLPEQQKAIFRENLKKINP